MRLDQANWASAHDWFVAMEPLGFGIWQVVCRPDPGEVGLQRFTDFQKLREWAGY